MRLRHSARFFCLWRSRCGWTTVNLRYLVTRRSWVATMCDSISNNPRSCPVLYPHHRQKPKPIAQRFVPVATARLLAGLSSARPAFAEAGNQPARLGVEFELACLDLGKVEYLVDQAEQVERRGNGGFVRPGATSSRKPRARQGVSRQTSNKRPPWICCAERGLLRRLGGDEESGVVPLARYGIPPDQ